MKLGELLIAIERIADTKGLSKPYIVGGLVRDKLLERTRDVGDVDITTGDESIHALSKEVARMLEGPNVTYEVMDDGHSTINIDGFKLDFSSNFIIPGIHDILRRGGIKDMSEMNKELYSRDFTCNAALMTMDLKTILDPTGLTVEDVKNKVIKTCLTPKLTLGYDNKRIVRAIYLAAKLDFDIDPDDKEWIKQNSKLIMNATPGYITNKLKKSAEYNVERTRELLTELGLWRYIPPIPEISLQIAASKQKKKKNKRVDMDVRPYPSPLFKNFDYGGPEDGSDVSPGTGLYQGNMDKYKSTKDFIEKSRKRKHRKKAFKGFIAKVSNYREQGQVLPDNETYGSFEKAMPEYIKLLKIWAARIWVGNKSNPIHDNMDAWRSLANPDDETIPGRDFSMVEPGTGSRAFKEHRTWTENMFQLSFSDWSAQDFNALFTLINKTPRDFHQLPDQIRIPIERDLAGKPSQKPALVEPKLGRVFINRAVKPIDTR